MAKDVETSGIFEFTMGTVTSWVVRLPNSTSGHEARVVNWLIDRFGMDDTDYWSKIFTKQDAAHNRLWKRGSICTFVYQEYWFTNREDAIETFLVFG